MNGNLPSRMLRWEPWLVWILGAAAFASVPVALGEIGISWDALNHHIYLGWVAESPRFNRDFAAASYQAYQYPYLYWPVYKLALAEASGVTAGVTLALLHSLVIPATWMLARWCCPGTHLSDLALRFLGVVLALIGGLTLSLLDSTSNDLLASIPFLWGFALCTCLASGQPQAMQLRVVVASGLLVGVAVGFKLSHGPLALAVPLLWCLGSSGVRHALQRLALATGAALIGYFAVYGRWGWQLWHHFGNPIYPFYDGYFEGARSFFGWRHP